MEEQTNKLNSVQVDPEQFQNLERVSCGRILGVDYGEKNVGLAISDSEQRQAFAYDTIKMSDKFFYELKKICDAEEIDKIVVGLPIGMKGEFTRKTEEVVFFIGQLEEQVKIAAVTEDERLSTVEGLKFSGGHGRDESAARVILQRFLDRRAG